MSFSVSDLLPSCFHQAPTPYERLRAERIARAELETPLVRGMRLLPVFSPGRCTRISFNRVLASPLLLATWELPDVRRGEAHRISRLRLGRIPTASVGPGTPA